MSTLLDSLRQAKQADAEAAHPGATARQVETILAALGYALRQPRVRVFRYAVGGLAVAAVALLGWAVSERSASIPPDEPVAVHLPAADAESPAPAAADGPVPVAALDPADDTGPRPLPDPPNLAEAGDQGPSDVMVEAPAEAADEVDRDHVPADSVDPEPVAPESRADDPVPRTAAGARPPPPPIEPPLPPATDETPPAPGDLAPPRPPTERGRVSELFATALALQRAGDLGGAIAEYQTLLSETAGSAQVHNNMGLLYRAQDRFDDAAREFEHAIAIDPRHSKAQNNLGVVRMHQARHEDAAAAFREARRLDGTNLDAWVNLALAVQAAGDPVAARRTLVGALSVDARHGPTHYNLARLFELGGDVSRAVEHYARFVEYSGAEHAELVETVRDRIAALRGAGPLRY